MDLLSLIPRSGDACPKCAGIIITVNTKVHGNRRVRYLGCRRCGYRPARNKVILQLSATGVTNTPIHK